MVSKELRNVLLNNSERMKVGSRPRRAVLSCCSRFVGGAGAQPPAWGSQSLQWARAARPGVSEPPVGAGGLAASFPQSVSWGTGACLVLCGPWFHVSLTVAFRACVLLALLCSQLISLSSVCFTRPTSVWSEGPGRHIFSEQGSDTVLSRGPTGVSRVTAALLLMARGPHAFLVFSEFPSFSVLFKC